MNIDPFYILSYKLGYYIYHNFSYRNKSNSIFGECHHGGLYTFVVSLGYLRWRPLKCEENKKKLGDIVLII